ncbi:hypothetical protein P9112_014375 [Eukaryota sp. TZLM1-RC]
MTGLVTLNSQMFIRRCHLHDVYALQTIHDYSFPIVYPLSYFESLPLNPFAFCAVQDEYPVGAIISDIRYQHHHSMNGLDPPFSPEYSHNFLSKGFLMDCLKRWFVPPRRLLYVLTIVVDKQHRCKGIGRKLINHLIDEARKSDFEGIYLHSSVINDSATFFYQSVGFTRVTKLESFYSESRCRLDNRDAFLWFMKL